MLVMDFPPFPSFIEIVFVAVYFFLLFSPNECVFGERKNLFLMREMIIASVNKTPVLKTMLKSYIP